MKNIVIIILLAAAAVSGGLYFLQTHKARQAEASADALQQKVGELQSGMEEQEQKETALREQLAETRAEAAARIQQAVQANETLQKTLTNQAGAPGQPPAKPSNPFAEMFKSPEMKEMIRNQQKTALGGMVDKNYGKLFSDLRLTAEQSSALKDLILNKQLGAAELGMSMFTEDFDSEKRAELIRQMKSASDAGDAQIKEFLGEANFQQFEAYEKSLGERMVVSGFKDQLGSSAGGLSEAQEQQLIQALTHERESFKFTTDLSSRSSMNGDFAAGFTEEKVDLFLQELGQLNQQYLAQGQRILSPDQFASFEKYISQQQAMQKAGMQMALKMFAPPKPGKN